MKNKAAAASSQPLFVPPTATDPTAPPPTTVPDLLKYCRAGDQKAWTELILQYQWLVFAVPRRMGISPQDAEDISQLVFHALSRKIGEIKDEHHLKAWLGKTAKARSVDFLRSKGNQLTVALEDDPTPDPDLERAEQQDIIRKAVASIKNEKYRNLIRLSMEREGLPDDELAYLLDIPVGSLATTRERATEAFKIALNKEGWRH